MLLSSFIAAGSLILTYFVSKNVLSDSFSRLEDREVHKNVERVQDAISATASSLESRTYDWASWDDAYQFVSDRNSEFVESNLASHVPSNMGLAGICFFSRDGKEIFSRFAPDEAKLISAKSFNAQVKLSDRELRPLSGLIKINDGLYSFSVRPVRDTNEKLSANGWVLFIQRYSHKIQQNLEGDLKLDFSLIPIAQSAATGNDSVVVHKLGDDSLVASTSINDFSGNAVGQLLLVEPREINLLGNSTTWLVLVLVLMIGTLAILLFARHLKGLASRLMILAAQVNSVNVVTGDGHINVVQEDEIGHIGTSINRMLESLRTSTARAEQSRMELLQVNESLEYIVAERTSRIARVNTILQNALDGIASINSMGVIESANPTLERLFATENLVGTNFQDRVGEQDLVLWQMSLQRMAYSTREDFELSGQAEDGRELIMQVMLIAEHDENSTLAYIHTFVKDVTDQRRAERELARQALSDDLTGLPNRRKFHELVRESLSYAALSPAVLFIDVDNFKNINDSRGHEVGDEFLRVVAGHFQAAIDETYTLARIGGDEFTVLIPNAATITDADECGQKIQESLAKPLVIAGLEVFVTCSIGYSVAGENCRDAAQLMGQADTAMYQAKAQGKAKVVGFSQHMTEAIVERIELENGLRRAIEREEFQLLYQPLISLGTNELVGVEALIRWNHPELGSISPIQFIPVAEETGLIVPIGKWVLKTAMRELAQMNSRRETHLRMNINVSRRQLLDANLERDVRDALIESGVAPELITLEVTESLAMEDSNIAERVLRRLSNLGVLIALDDFGTGFSSLSTLQSLPVDKVKIDRSFINLMGTEGQQSEVVAAILALCRAMNLEVTGEGIETDDQLSTLAKLGCEVGQGYFISRPMSSCALERFVANYSNLNQAA